MIFHARERMPTVKNDVEDLILLLLWVNFVMSVKKVFVTVDLKRKMIIVKLY